MLPVFNLSEGLTLYATSVRFVRGFNPHWLRTTPLLVTVKFGL